MSAAGSSGFCRIIRWEDAGVGFRQQKYAKNRRADGLQNVILLERFSISGRCGTGFLFKHLAEVLLAAEAGVLRNPADRNCRIPEKLFGVFNPTVDQVLMRRPSGGFGKNIVKINFAQMNAVGNIFQLDRVFGMCFDESFCLSDNFIIFSVTRSRNICVKKK